ncbi:MULTISPECIES: DUF3240 family protein [Methylococcus]|jgi:sulfatase maturation enzyme AslB (radical SAM superfamily)|uniref:DUF3240 family protein n=1 Tax=Methylococcus TaxID=413 RepID=UPI00030EE44A|nr:DUF3240 family protein [Methylococcus capsulatus]QXP86792.1 DUF3240 family protein [Methylococcus capsulatus]QXP91881.1 DUF3240 family protein [Methylococcus capsulatus]QXP93530.1 DUF3240 family protein [Methylococcus capsulatus]UQN11765.1 DUF3240 family protein [Methylococcus capsulatus]
MSDLVLLTLLAPPQLEDPLVDWLLSTPAIQGFSSQAASSHSSRTEGMSLNEQVAGRTRRIRFEAQLSADGLRDTLNVLRTDFRGSGIHYWVTPVLDVGGL